MRRLKVHDEEEDGEEIDNYECQHRFMPLAFEGPRYHMVIGRDRGAPRWLRQGNNKIGHLYYY
jgi:hypothetical protein